MMNWFNDFEKKFSITKTDENRPFLIIEGECRYLQGFGEFQFQVAIDSSIKEYLNRNNCKIYDEVNEIAFLVSGWIKVQDSLEMIFNLMTGSTKRSLEVLSYLRSNEIPPHEFALYLYKYHRIILVNRFTFPPSDENRKSQLFKIKKIITSLSSCCHYLIVGDREHKALENMVHVKEIGRVLHPSGVVLNIHSEDYYNTWYNFDDNFCKMKTDGFTLSEFMRI